ncbi:MAG: hypothetical protein ACK58T_02640, partial [Phycisphaerae bacterium]
MPQINVLSELFMLFASRPFCHCRSFIMRISSGTLSSVRSSSPTGLTRVLLTVSAGAFLLSTIATGASVEQALTVADNSTVADQAVKSVDATPAQPEAKAAPQLTEMRTRAMQFLEVTQRADGSWTKSDAVGITGLVTAALLRSGRSVDDAMVSKGLGILVATQQPSGGIFAPGSRHENYETCIALLALAEANADGRYTAHIRKAEEFLRGLQWDQGEGIESSDGAYGGGGYDSQQR